MASFRSWMRRRAIRETLQANEHDFFGQAFRDEPVAVEMHDPRRVRRRLGGNRGIVSPKADGENNDTNQSCDETTHGLFLPGNFGETI